jgi:carbon-monoxide dehydrogenase small subunit/xanthine dehydrogenase small subunit
MIARRWVVNGVPCRVQVDPLMPLLRVLREVLGLTGSKEGCGEGECGACTILLDDRPVTACLVAAGQVLDGSRILTIEGVSETPRGRAILDAFVDRGAVQCGSCIPGMVVAAYALLRDRPDPSERDVREALSGNLCRCTGYVKIVSAILAAATRTTRDATMSASAAQPPAAGLPLTPRGIGPDGDPFFTATSIDGALAIRARHPDCVLLAGGTDLMVGWNGDREQPPARVLSLEAVEELSALREIDGALRIGAMTRVERLARDPLVARLTPALAQAARQLGARGTRERATIGGNVVNASPAADLVPPLFAACASLVLASPSGRREVPITAFYRGYKRVDLAPPEILVEIRVPALPDGAREGFVKIGPRRAQAIAKVSVAVRLTIDAERIAEIAIAAGSVAPTVVRLARTEATLRGARIDENLAPCVEAAAASEVSPVSDVRSTADYRRAMTARLLRDLLVQLIAETGDAGATPPQR